MSEVVKLFKVTIDNISVEVEAGTTILNAARKIGGDVTPPAMCYYSKLQGSGGKCRTCLVEVTAGSTADPRPMPKLVEYPPAKALPSAWSEDFDFCWLEFTESEFDVSGFWCLYVADDDELDPEQNIADSPLQMLVVEAFDRRATGAIR